MQNKKPAKKSDINKKSSEPKHRTKKPAKKTPSRVTKSIKRSKAVKAAKKVGIKAIRTAWKHINENMERDSRRQRAIERAGRVIAGLGYTYEQGNHLVIIPKIKVIMAFDLSPELLEGVKKHADVNKSTVVHIDGTCFGNFKDFNKAVMLGVETAKDINSAKVTVTSKRRLKKSQKTLDTNLK